MNNILYVGMDDHKENYTVCCYSFEKDQILVPPISSPSTTSSFLSIPISLILLPIF